MKAFVVVISGVLLAAPGPAQASDDNATSNGSQPSSQATELPGDSPSSEAEENGERRICRRVETNTGSRVPWRRVCMTERQWRVYNRHN